jgi:hypothetical protein
MLTTAERLAIVSSAETISANSFAFVKNPATKAQTMRASALFPTLTAQIQIPWERSNYSKRTDGVTLNVKLPQTLLLSIGDVKKKKKKTQGGLFLVQGLDDCRIKCGELSLRLPDQRAFTPARSPLEANTLLGWCARGLPRCSSFPLCIAIPHPYIETHNSTSLDWQQGVQLWIALSPIPSNGWGG